MEKPKNSKTLSYQTDNSIKIFFPMSGFSNYMAIVEIMGFAIACFPIGLLTYAFYVSIFTQTQEIALSQHITGKISETELEWIFNKIGEWLNLSITGK